MTNAKPWISIAAVAMTALFAYVARHAVYDLIVLPMAYVLWQLRGLLGGVAQLVQWGLLVVLVALAMAWQLVPRVAVRGHRMVRGAMRQGDVHAAALGLRRARSSNYFRWQLAHRLGRAASQLGDLPGPGPGPAEIVAPAPIAEYLDAGLNHSFVDYASRRMPWARQVSGPLNLDPEDAVRYLESHLAPGGEIHADSR